MDPNIENRGGRSVLFEATQSSSDKAIDILLEFKADTTVCDNDGNLLLELANGNFHVSYVQKNPPELEFIIPFLVGNLYFGNDWYYW